MISKSSKRIDILYHFIREHVANGNAKLEYMSTEAMPADILTKPLTVLKHKNCIEFFGLK